ncbi:FAD-binding oxidoreductase [Microbacterium pseudoresistens]|uniref:D-amino-acid dehydrogenase n=1 Tax=Microbacterium pseudoresistens TaxID=640634 RepID=A0A7Y9ETK1_9MICO|nr:FAD-dependent oxidoreductase [Microbacterium pseudoresistens]NYD53713.1 D-amino-acid dehydrogenase [Microbacterium pseudoresistens]
MSSTENFVVIGGGIVGAAAAYRLAVKGLGVTLISNNREGEATMAGAGGVDPGVAHTPPTAWYPMAFASARFYKELTAQLEADGETDTGYEVCGSLVIAMDDTEAERLKDLLLLFNERTRSGAIDNGDLSIVDARGAQELFPPLQPGTVGIHSPTGARVDGRRLRDSLLRAFLKRGGNLVRGEAELSVDGDDVRVTVDGTAHPADRIVLAPGAWTSDLLRPLGHELPVFPQRGQLMHMGLRDTDTSKYPIITGFHHSYIIPFGGGRIVAGATREDDAAFDYRETVGGTLEVVADALRVAPGLAEASVLETRVGFRPFSPDRLPIVGALEGWPSVVIATGLGSSGLTMGPFVGSTAADLAVGEQVALDLAPYSPARFK